MIAVIAGASGLTGSKLLSILLDDFEITKVIAVGRRALGVSSPKLEEVHVTDLSELISNQEKLRGDIYFCCLGTTIKAAGSREAFRKIDYQAIADFGKIAKGHSARAFTLISAAGANKDSKIFYNRVKGETEEFLKRLNFKKLVIAQPGLLLGNRQEHRAGEEFAISLMRVLSPVLPGAVKNRMATDVDHLVEILWRIAKHPEPGERILAAKDLA